MAWSDAARAAALEMRRRKAAGQNWRLRPKEFSRENLSSARLFKNKVTKFPKYEDIAPKNIGVPLSKLSPTQRVVSMKGVRAYAKGKGNFQDQSIEVVKSGDKYLIVDGHHRAAAAVFNTKRTGRYYLVAKLVGRNE